MEEYSSSRSFFEISPDCESKRLKPMICLKDFGKRVAILPIALLYKAYKTIFRILGLVVSAGLVLITLGTSEGIRTFFVRRTSSLAKDIADWVLLPFAIFSCFSRLILAFLVHPNLYFNH